MRDPIYYGSVYAVVKNLEGKVLYLRRANSGYKDGFLQFPSGHIEGDETPVEAIIRELKEEVNIDVKESDLEMFAISRTSGKPNSNYQELYIDFFFEVLNYSGEVKNMEEDKCSELLFLDPDQDRDDFVEVNEAIKYLGKGLNYLEFKVD